jgi:hypothetical protein
MFLLYLEIVMLVLSIFAVGAAGTVLVHDDPEIMAWLRKNLSIDRKRYTYVARHSPRYVTAQKEQEQACYRRFLVSYAT